MGAPRGRSQPFHGRLPSLALAGVVAVCLGIALLGLVRAAGSTSAVPSRAHGLNDGRGRDRHSDGDGNTRRTYDRAQLHSDGFSDRVPDSIPRPRADSPPRGPGG